MNRLRAALPATLLAPAAAPAQAPASAGAAPKTKKIGIESNGRTITLARGQHPQPQADPDRR